MSAGHPSDADAGGPAPRRNGLALVVAVSRNGVIGRDNALPWHLPEDMRHFRRVTLGHAVIMGRKTFESIGKPLAKRRNIVVTRDPRYAAEGCEVVHDLDSAIAAAHASDPEPRVIGGSSLYAEALPRVTRIYLTRVEREVEGDARFVDLDMRQWRVTESRPAEGMTFLTLERI